MLNLWTSVTISSFCPSFVWLLVWALLFSDSSSAALLILWKTVSLLAVPDFLHVHSFTIMALRFNLSSSYFLKCYSFRFLVRCPLLSNLRDLSVDLCFCPPGPSFELFLFFHPSLPSTLPPPHPLAVARHPACSSCGLWQRGATAPSPADRLQALPALLLPAASTRLTAAAATTEK